MSTYRILSITFLAAGVAITSASPAFAQQVPGQFPGQFQGQIPPQLLLLRGLNNGGAQGGFFPGNQPGRQPMNNMGGFGQNGNFRNRFDFRNPMPFPTTPIVDNPNQNGRNTTIYQNVNTSYLGGLASGTGAVNQFGQFGQVGGAGFGATGGFVQPPIIFGQPTPAGASGQFGQFGQPMNPAQVGAVGGVGGKFGANGFATIGGGGQFGSRYGL